jgi:DNA-binding SARP family transcriptional activator/tetratricopeptide (TPR) repeat protein
MRFALLGPLTVADSGGREVVLAGPRQRVLLAALLLHANVPVPADALAEMVWDRSPPPGAVATLRSYVRRLRQALGSGAARVVARHPGYLIRVDQQELDVLEFEALCRDASAALRAGDWTNASSAAVRASQLWRAAPLLDVPAEVLHDEFVPGLERLRLQVMEDRFEAGLRLGQHQELITPLLDLTARHPLRERFHAQLMLALAGAGRQAEALDAYEKVRLALADELGIEPGSELRGLHQQILVGGTAEVTAQTGLPRQAEPVPDTPRELPPTVSGFTGRSGELQALDRMLDRHGQPVPGTVVISAIGGTAGVGKTALALCWAHRVAHRFPDGQLYVDLRGYAPGEPVSAADALAGFLRSLGLPGQRVPADTEERAARYRSLLAGRRMLVLLDNAGSVEQVRPLLPGADGCVLVVTSRDSLAGLVSRDGAQRLDLDLLPLHDAVALLRALIGDRVDAEPAAAQELARQCARLPLALRVAAELAMAWPAEPLADLVRELAGQRRLDVLDASGDSSTRVRAVFSSSYLHLDAGTARAFRLAGLHPGSDLDRYALAALTQTSVAQATCAFGVLFRSYLIQRTGPGQYGMHDLLRAYAREAAEAHDTSEERRAALTRLFDYLLHTAAASVNTLDPARAARRPRIPPPLSPAPDVAEPTAARAWLDGQRASLVTVTAYMAANGWPDHATRMSAVLSRYLEDGGHFPEAITVHTHARDVARRVGDRVAEASALSSLGLVAWWQGRYEQADNYLRQAVAMFREAGDQNSHAVALINLSIVQGQQGRYEQAASDLHQALAMFREAGDRPGEIGALINLGMIEEQQGRYEQAASYYRQALTLSRDTGDQNSQAYALVSLGIAERRLLRFELATSHIRQGLSLFRMAGNRAAQSSALAALGDVELRQGHHERALDSFWESLALCRELGDRSGEAVALNGLGEALLAAGRPVDARAHHTAALRLAVQIGQKHEQARAHDALGAVHRAAGDLAQARRCLLAALTLYEKLGAEADIERVRTELNALTERQGR